VARKIILSPDADEEIDIAADWYQNREPGLDDRFLKALGTAFDMILRQPEFYPVRFGNSRCIKLKKFPYAVYYRYDADFVTI